MIEQVPDLQETVDIFKGRHFTLCQALEELNDVYMYDWDGRVRLGFEILKDVEDDIAKEHFFDEERYKIEFDGIYGMDDFFKWRRVYEFYPAKGPEGNA